MNNKSLEMICLNEDVSNSRHGSELHLGVYTLRRPPALLYQFQFETCEGPTES